MAFSFNGSSQYLSVGSGIITTYPFTMSIWARPSAFSSFNGFLGIGNSGSSPYYIFLGFNGSGQAYGGLSLSSDAAVATPATLTVNTWGHICFVVTSSTIQVFLNGTGTSVVNHSISFPTFDRVSVNSILRNMAATGLAAGNSAEPAIWNAALTNAEIASLAAGFTPDQIRPQSLQFYAPLVRDLVDVRGGRAITNVNGATVATHPRVIQ